MLVFIKSLPVSLFLVAAWIFFFVIQAKADDQSNNQVDTSSPLVTPYSTQPSTTQTRSSHLTQNPHATTWIDSCVKGVLKLSNLPRWKTGNHVRNEDKPKITSPKFEVPPLFDNSYGVRREDKFLLGPRDSKTSQYQLPLDGVYNPAAFKDVDPDGKEVTALVIRGERFFEHRPVKRESKPYLVILRPGEPPEFHSTPLIPTTLKEEKNGGMEDFRYFDLGLKPAEWQGKEYKKMLVYTAYDGKTPRLCGLLFNNYKDFDAGKYVKTGPLFNDADVLKNPAVPNIAWSKSAVGTQFKDPATGKVRTVVWFNEGNESHGGISSFELNDPIKQPSRPGESIWPYPGVGQRPVITSKPGTFTQNLVEPAFPPIVGPLSKEMQEDIKRKTGKTETEGIYVFLHGDAPEEGKNISTYQVGYRVFSLSNPTGKPIYESDTTFLKPETPEEIDQGQVTGVTFATGAVIKKDGTVEIYFGAGDHSLGKATLKMAKPN